MNANSNARATALTTNLTLILVTALVLGCATEDAGGSNGGNGGDGGKAQSSGGAGGKQGGKGGAGGGNNGSGGVAGGKGGAAPDPISVDDYPAKMAEATCGPIWECCMDNAKAKPTIGGTSDKACLVLRSAAARSGLMDLKKSIEAGRVAYDGVEVARCVARLDALMCSDTKETAETAYGPCLYLTPKVEVGGTCLISFDCIESFCDKPTLKCAARKEIGAACDTGDGCISRRCSSTDGVKKCVEPEVVVPTMVEGFCGALF